MLKKKMKIFGRVKIRTNKKILAIHEALLTVLELRLLVLAALAGMALQLSRNIPGGKWPDDKPPHKAGEAIIASTHPNIYKFFVLTNGIAFGSALLAIFLITIWPTRSKLPSHTASSATWVSLVAIAMSYVGSTMAIAPHTKSIIADPIVPILAMLGSILITLLISAFYPLMLFYSGRGTNIQLNEDLTIHHQICQLFETLLFYSAILLKSLTSFVLAQAKPFRLLLV
ncbi:uncharacterized protein LOC125187740 isoform X2 [Salvia hispanica]|uniref:uncharacterized protein LOC125187740 isoform X2 n=1 Tax=Salvia hispanica TaxID=49212 RepID=UPI0020090AC3|nr:uncharacterized protein LOC125187740 isoform X2 [Salvia hispanica]